MTIDTTVDCGGKSYDFHGLGGGLGFGAAVSWGAAWLNFPLETLDGWTSALRQISVSAQSMCNGGV
jgi:hypothetical protein